MSDSQVSVAAMLFELGIPVLIIALAVRQQRWRFHAAVILGALTPILFLYAFITAGYLRNPSDRGSVFAILAMWVMSFIAYAAILLGAIGLSFLPRPNNLYGRFFMGLVSAPCFYALFNLTT